MRARSNTICCDTLEDYIETAKATTSYISSRKSRPQPKKPVVKALEHQYKEAILDDDDFVPCSDQGQSSSDDWLDFEFNSNNALKNDQVSSLASSNQTLDTDCSDHAETRLSGDPILRRVMVIGLDGSGKHSLINAAFDCGRQSFENKTQILDLLTQTERDEDEDREVRYQFWIQNLKSADNKFKDQFKDLIKFYYKNVSLFVFMYSVTDKASFTCLEEAIKSVLQEIPAEKFTGVLVGTKCDLEQRREVSFDEARSLQEDFGLNSLVETHQMDKSFKRVFSDLLSKTEDSDSQRERRVSILSMD